MGTTGFALSPHKLSMCILLQAYALPSSSSSTLPPLPVSIRHKFSLFVLQMLKAHDDFLEPSFEELGLQLKVVLEDRGGLLVSHLANRLVNFLSPEDLCTFALGLRDLMATGLNAAPETVLREEEPLFIESNSLLGHFLRRCILAFNILSFEGTCKLLSDLDVYRQTMLTISSGDHTSLQNSVAKSVDEVSVQDDDQANDVEYFEHENLEVERILIGQERGKEAYERKVLQESFKSEGSFLCGEASSRGDVHGGGSTFSLSDLQNKDQSPKEGCFLRTNDQVDCFIRGLADIIDREVAVFSPDDVDFKLNQLEKLAPDFFKVHYLRYLNALSNGDYPAALDSLHRYFDYSAGKGALSSTVSAVATTGRSQAGLLALGSMHAHFGHTSQALQSLYEAVGIAQQSNDDACLAHALAALCSLVSEVGAPSDAKMSEASIPGLNVGNGPSLSVQEQLLLLLNCCLRRAMELNLPHLMAFSRLVLAKFNLKFVRRSLINGPRTSEQLGTSPIDVYKTLRLTPYLLSSITASSAAGSVANFGIEALRRVGGTSVVSANNQGLKMLGSNSGSGMERSFLCARTDPVIGSILQLAGTTHLLQASSWELYGSAPMARVSALIHATCYADVASADDSSLAYVKLAQHLAAHKSYKEACAALDIAEKKFPSAAKSRLKAACLEIIHERSLHRGDSKTAQATCDILSALFSPVPGVGMELKIDVARRHARTLLGAGQFAEAASVAHSLFNTCHRYKMQLDSIMSLLLLAEIHKKAGSFVSGLPYALASLTLSKSFNLDLIHAVAMVTLAELWLGLGPIHAQQALSLLQQCMPLVLGHGGRELRARTYLAVARCHLCDPNYSVHTNPQEVCEPLQAAAEEYEALEDNEQASEVFYLQARIFHVLGAVEERDHAAALFRKYTLSLHDAQAVETPTLLE